MNYIKGCFSTETATENKNKMTEMYGPYKDVEKANNRLSINCDSDSTEYVIVPQTPKNNKNPRYFTFSSQDIFLSKIGQLNLDNRSP